jgi:phenylpyruvate tautomerase PptA (4-oxalocrotonate tautomerase family)
MPVVTIQAPAGSLSDDQKAELIRKATERRDGG